MYDTRTLLLNDQMNLLNVHNDFLSVGVSGLDNSSLLQGRPFGGCAILYRKSLLCHISRLSSTSKRFCGVVLTDQSGTSYLLVCVYLPYYDGSVGARNEFLISLAELEGFISMHRTDHILIAGDFNVDFQRNSANLVTLQSFMSD